MQAPIASPVMRHNAVVTPFRPKQPQPLRIIAMGDSVIYGYGDLSGGGWVERLRRQWMAPDSAGHVIYNLGVRGDKVAQVSDRLELEFRSRGELRNRLPDRLILSVGTNDSPRVGRADGKTMTPIEIFGPQVEALLDRAQGLCPVLFVGMIPVNPSKMPFLECLYYNHADQYQHKEVIRRACEARRIPFLDCFELWLARGASWVEQRLGSDGLHPNDLGYESLLADVTTWQPIAQLAAMDTKPIT